MPADSATSSPGVVDLQRRIEELAVELRARTAERDEGLQREAATAEVLRIVNTSSGDLGPAFDAMIEKAMTLCGADFGLMLTYDGRLLTARSMRNVPEAFQAYWKQPVPVEPGSNISRVFRDGKTVYVPNLVDSEGYREKVAVFVAGVEQGGVRSCVWVPLLDERGPVGVLIVFWQDVRSVSSRQIALLESFASQAVIAMENARLLGELRQSTDDLTESLAYQTATSELLEVISRSASDVQPVLDTMLAAAARLCDTTSGSVAIRQDEVFRHVATMGVDAQYGELLRRQVHRIDRSTTIGRVALSRGVVQIEDARADPDYSSVTTDAGNIRTLLGVPLLRDDEVIGVIMLVRDRVETFNERQVALVKTFADQAVIAMENARLLTELREALERQTATAEILSVINASPDDLAPVFDTMLERAMQLCDAVCGGLFTYDGEAFHTIATRGVPQAFAEFRARHPPTVARGGRTGLLLETRRPVQTLDVTETDAYRAGDMHDRAMADLGGARTILNVPLLKDEAVVGFISVYRTEKRAFDDRQVALLQNFAAQAVIAMENARLLTEQREALERQTATAEVLRTINASPGVLEPVFDVILAKAHDLCGATLGSLQLFDGEQFRAVATRGMDDAFAAFLRRGYRPSVAATLSGEQSTQIADVTELARQNPDDPVWRATTELGRIRTLLAVPLLKDGNFLGRIVAARQEVRPFTDKQIALLENFAAQAVIAMENARLLTEQREALERQTATADILGVISRSATDVQPVFDAIAESALRLLKGWSSIVWVIDDDMVRPMAVRGGAPGSGTALRERVAGLPIDNPLLRDVLGARGIRQVSDSEAPDVDPVLRELARLRGWRANLLVPILRDGQPVGIITVGRVEPGPFSERETGLLQSFADQAAIAMENTRLLEELRERTEALAQRNTEFGERIEQQSATIDVLKVMSSSPGDPQPVFDMIALRSRDLCNGLGTSVFEYDGELVYHRAITPGEAPDEEVAAYDALFPMPPTRGSLTCRAILDRQIVHVRDLQSEDVLPAVRNLGYRSQLTIPFLRDGVAIGAITLSRREAGGFTDSQVALLQTFAEQAVIAITSAENHRALQQRTAELDRSVAEQREALEQQTATSEVLQVINSSPGDLGPVFEAMLEKAMRLCEATIGDLRTYDGTDFRQVAARGMPDAYVDYYRNRSVMYGPGTGPARILASEAVVHIPDLTDTEAYRRRDPDRVALVELGGARASLIVPLNRDEKIAGLIMILRNKVGAFSDNQIGLLQNFAAQAVIAMDNARLLSEVRRREQELSVTFDNMGDGVAMFDADLRLAASNRNFQRLMGLDEPILATRPTYADYLRLLAERGEFGTNNVEAELASRLEHTDRELRLERTRPDDTMIEVRRNAVPGGGFVLIYSDITERRRAEVAIRAARDAAESALERQTATADILKVIASSPTDVQPVLEAVVNAAVRFCGAADATILLRDGDGVISRAHEGPLSYNAGDRRTLDRGAAGGRAIVDILTCHLPDAEALDPAEFANARRFAALHGFRAVVAAPLKRENTAVGAVVLRKVEAGPFTPQQIELLETFAAQAVIAIENVRLFTELRESLEQQTASGEILQVISQSPTDVTPVLDAVAKAAVRFCGAEDAHISLQDGGELTLAAHEGPIASDEVGRRIPLDTSTIRGGAIVAGQTIHVPDVMARESAQYVRTRELARRYGFRAVLAAPMLREGRAIGSVTLRKSEPGAFAPRQIELLETFAAQAVIAIENVRLFTELRDSLERLKAAQANLIQSEKMASLGQLTAGIAHEIKNPLNFVNNFAGLSSELLEELKQSVDALMSEPDEDKRTEIQETMDLLTGNLVRIVEHGRRADGIVKSMLSHSRGGGGDWRPSDINALVEEALNLAYHGARAQDNEFNVTLERDFEKGGGPIDVVPQDVTRVFLNLFGNGFYAVNKRRAAAQEAGFRPTIKVTTRDLGEVVEVRVRDNGTGIAPGVRDKLFQPFFTTKPTGEGTGLGLSISYDIVTQQHGGTIDVESEPGSFTEFTVRLPRSRRVTTAERA